MIEKPDPENATDFRKAFGELTVLTVWSRIASYANMWYQVA